MVVHLGTQIANECNCMNFKKPCHVGVRYVVKTVKYCARGMPAVPLLRGDILHPSTSYRVKTASATRTGGR